MATMTGERDLLAEAERRVRSGKEVWAEPFREWCDEMAMKYGWAVVAAWADREERGFAKRVQSSLTIPTEVVDRCLLQAGGVSFDEMYPPTELAPERPVPDLPDPPKVIPEPRTVGVCGPCGGPVALVFKRGPRLECPCGEANLSKAKLLGRTTSAGRP